ncbi:MAG: hypothetical protein ABIP42_09805 [Planctomycetota bacterium]
MPSLEAQVRAVQGKVSRNLAFGVARGLTTTAKQTSEKLRADLPSIFDRPTPFTRNAMAITPATKTSLVASVFVKDAQAAYLQMEETGGVRSPMPGSPINLPVSQRTNAYGNIARGAIGRAKAKGTVFVSKGQGRTAHLPPGLYERLGTRTAKGMGSARGRKKTTGRGAQKSRVKLLVAFERKANYAPRFGFKTRSAVFATSVLKANIASSIEAAMASAN